MRQYSVGFLPRLGAFALDLIPILGYIIILFLVGLGLSLGPLKGNANNLSDRPILYDFIAFITTILPVVFYFALQESSPKMASWGKRRLGLQVVTQTGDRLSFGRALLRSAIKFLPWQLAHTCLFHIAGWPFAVQSVPAWVMTGFITLYIILAAYFLTLLLKPHRTLYDLVAGSYVTKAK